MVSAWALLDVECVMRLRRDPCDVTVVVQCGSRRARRRLVRLCTKLECELEQDKTARVHVGSMRSRNFNMQHW